MEAALKSSTTHAEATYLELRADLLACRLPPGEPIGIKETALRLRTNPSAVREALSRLSSEGLAYAEPQKGFRATPISIEELRDLTEVRIANEQECLRRAIAHGNVDWEAQIAARCIV